MFIFYKVMCKNYIFYFQILRVEHEGHARTTQHKLNCTRSGFGHEI